MKNKTRWLVIVFLAFQTFSCALGATPIPASEMQVSGNTATPLPTIEGFSSPVVLATATPTGTSIPPEMPVFTPTATLTSTLTATPTAGLILLPSEPPVFQPATPTPTKMQNKIERYTKGDNCT